MKKATTKQAKATKKPTTKATKATTKAKQAKATAKVKQAKATKATTAVLTVSPKAPRMVLYVVGGNGSQFLVGRYDKATNAFVGDRDHVTGLSRKDAPDIAIDVNNIDGTPRSIRYANGIYCLSRGVKTTAQVITESAAKALCKTEVAAFVRSEPVKLRLTGAPANYVAAVMPGGVLAWAEFRKLSHNPNHYAQAARA